MTLAKKTMDFYNADAREYENRHDNATTLYIRKNEQKLVKRFAKGRVLDVGCGTGLHLKFAEKNCSSTVLKGIDSSVEMLKIAEKNTKAELTLCNAEKLPFDDECFDTILCFNVMNFLDKGAVKEINRVAKHNGVLICSAASVYDNDGKKTKNVRINNQRLRMHLFEKKEFVELFENFRLVEFHALFHLQRPYWNWFRNFTFLEKIKLFAEKFIHAKKEKGCIYMGVFRKT